MSASDPLVASLLTAVQGAPDDVPLRLHLATLLADRGEHLEAVRHGAAALAIDPTDEPARGLLLRLLRGSAEAPASPTAGAPSAGPPPSPAVPQPTVPAPAATPTTVRPEPSHSDDEQAEEPAEAVWDLEDSDVTLADVGGMSVAKEHLEAAVLAPMRHPELRRLHHQSRSGGVLLYGPPGCGKTFLARAVAGELEARFLALCCTDLTEDDAEAEIGRVFETARTQAPVLLFLDDVDLLGRRDPQRRAASNRAVSRLAAELDQGPAGNYGVTVLAATAAPWDVDPVLRRPGRLERTLLVLPPDKEARAVIFAQHLGADADHVDRADLALHADGYSGADIASAVGLARRNAGGRLTTDDVREALSHVAPSADAWLEAAARSSLFDVDEGAYVGLREYLRSRPQ